MKGSVLKSVVGISQSVIGSVPGGDPYNSGIWLEGRDGFVEAKSSNEGCMVITRKSDDSILGHTLLDGTSLHKVSSAVSSDSIDITKSDGAVKFTQDHLRVSLNELSFKEFTPFMDSQNIAAQIDIAPEVLKSIWSSGEKTCAESNGSDILDGMKWDINGSVMTWTVSDGRTSVWKHTIKSDKVLSEKPLSGVVSADHIRSAIKTLDKMDTNQVKLLFWDNDLATGFVSFDGVESGPVIASISDKKDATLFIMRNKRTKFANTDQVFNNNSDRSDIVEVDINELSGLLKSVGVFADKSSNVRISIQDSNIELSISSKEGDLKNFIHVDGTEGRVYTLALGYGKMDKCIQTLKSLSKDGKVVMHPGDGTTPAVFESADKSTIFILAVVKV